MLYGQALEIIIHATAIQNSYHIQIKPRSHHYFVYILSFEIVNIFAILIIEFTENAYIDY